MNTVYRIITKSPRTRSPLRLTRLTRLTVPVVLAVLALLVSSCSFLTGDDDEESTTTTTVAEADLAADETEVIVTPTTSAIVVEEEPEVTLSISSPLSTAGLGPIAIGHTLEQAVEASGAVFEEVAGGTDSCKLYAVSELPSVQFVALNNEIVRIDTTNQLIRTVSGYGVNSLEVDISTAFGERIEQGPQDDEIQYVPVDEGDADKRVIWQVDSEDIIYGMRTGRVPHVNPVTPCS